MNDKKFCFLSFLGIIAVFSFIEEDSWIKTKFLSLVGGAILGLDIDAIVYFILVVFSIFLTQVNI